MRKHFLAVIAYAVITAVMTSPFVSLSNLRGRVLSDGDPGYAMWAISWINHALLTQPPHLFAANIFYPSPGSLAYSEHTFGIAVLVHPWYWFSGDPFVPYNLLFIFSYFASAVGMYLLCFYYTGSASAAFIGGLIFGFCFFRAHHFGHLSLISNQWFPFVVLIFYKLRERFRIWLAGLWVVLVVLQCLTNWYNASFMVTILAWAMVSDFLQNRWDAHTLRRFAICALIALLLIVPFYRPYSRLPKSGDLSENKAFAADLGSYFQAPLNTLLGRRLQNTRRWIWEERSTFVGYLPFLLALAGVLLGRSRFLVWTYASLAVVAFILSLGPESLDFPGLTLPAQYVYWLCPPVAQLRAAARFAIVVMFCVAVLAAMALSRIGGGRWWVLPISLFVLLEYFPVGLGYDPATAPGFKPRPVDVWLKEHNLQQCGPPGWKRPKQRDRKVVLELPDYNGTAQWWSESRYMLYSTYHWMNLVNGYSRFYPSGFASDFKTYSQFPSDESIRFMRNKGIDYVVVHCDQYDERYQRKLQPVAGLVAQFGSDRVYQIR